MINSIHMPGSHPLLRYSLVLVWLATALVSVWELHGQSRELLVNFPLADPRWPTVLILAGAAADAALGLWMALRPSRLACAAALALLIVMTLAATWLATDWWLHPLGPLTKNIPMAAILWVLWRESPSRPSP
jgi:hypothetical protein